MPREQLEAQDRYDVTMADDDDGDDDDTPQAAGGEGPGGGGGIVETRITRRLSTSISGISHLSPFSFRTSSSRSLWWPLGRTLPPETEMVT